MYASSISVSLVALTLALSGCNRSTNAPAGPIKIKVGMCARTASVTSAPFAVATKMGWFKDEGLDVEQVNLAGATDCVTAVARGELDYAQPTIEPVAMAHVQGAPIKIFYTAIQTSHYGLAVLPTSPAMRVEDLKGKSIGVISMASGAVLFVRALVTGAGLNPETDVRLVVAGEGAQAAELLRRGEVDALGQYDTQFALIENAGVPLRFIDVGKVALFPANSFVALASTLQSRRAQAVGFARAYAKGTLFTLTNPEAAIKITYEVYPQLRSAGKEPELALKHDLHILERRREHWLPNNAGVSKWGESSRPNYENYLTFLATNNVIARKLAVDDIVDNSLIDEANDFDAEAIAEQARRAGGQ